MHFHLNPGIRPELVAQEEAVSDTTKYYKDQS